MRDFLTAPFGGEVGAQRRVRGPSPCARFGKGPLTRPKRVDLSPKGEVKKEHCHD
ncbi:hypothetical protein SAMN02745223_01105 [Devosia limi DSM 17137]|uniref:Uncharacterized protein n=1 Tax=Devosia limi DSM 17137 TaxID=1121477 RepID=A0A1M4W3B1_9HYPH|nr:hypothetical protein SAMN02745223_01105 [Devosia limi DSM 17137]